MKKTYGYLGLEKETVYGTYKEISICPIPAMCDIGKRVTTINKIIRWIKNGMLKVQRWNKWQV